MSDNEPELTQRDQEVMAEGIVYAQIYREERALACTPPIARQRARDAMEDFRESRVKHLLGSKRETRQ